VATVVFCAWRVGAFSGGGINITGATASFVGLIVAIAGLPKAIATIRGWFQGAQTGSPPSPG
jgi:hypothetical protein